MSYFVGPYTGQNYKIDSANGEFYGYEHTEEGGWYFCDESKNEKDLIKKLTERDARAFNERKAI